MANLFLVGHSQSAEGYIDDYINRNNFAPYEVERFDEKIKIEHCRKIKKSLSLRSHGKRLFVFLGELTLEAQNSLLKSIEESGENIHFIFNAPTEDSLLPTINSRCLVINLNSQFSVDGDLLRLVSEACSKEKISWQTVDDINDYISGKDLAIVIPVMRNLLLEGVESKRDTKRHYFFLKKILKLLPLAQNNNVSEKIIMETVLTKEPNIL